MKKIFILYTSVGFGHKSMGENIGYHLDKAGYEVKLHDVLQLQAGSLVNVSTWVHQFINKYLPFVWGWLYTVTHKGVLSDLTMPWRVKTASKNYAGLKKVVDEFQPDLVISVQTSASAIMQFLKDKGWYKNLWGIGFSDPHLHRYWLYQGADFYLANIPEQKQEMIELGIAADKINVIGMTLKPRPEVDTAAVRQKLGVNPGDKVILVASGSLGTGLSLEWFKQLAEEVAQRPGTKLIIVCGKNQELKAHLDRSVKSAQVIVRGFYRPMAELYAISDIFLTKPGGLTVSETLQWHLPLLIIHWLPGQEEINYRYLTERKIVMERPSTMKPAIIWPIIDRELHGGVFRQSLVSNAAAIELIQSGHEGQRLIQAVRKVFHEV